MAACILAVFCLMFSSCSAMSVSDMENLTSTVFSGYNQELLPLINQSDTVIVNVTLGLVSINDFNELSGVVSLSLIVIMRWYEERLTWDPDHHKGRQSLVVRPRDLWRPRLYLLQAADKIEEIGLMSSRIRLFYNGAVLWSQGKVIRATCSVDVKFFPYDIQTCIFDFATPYYTSSELQYHPESVLLDRSYFTSNSQWEVLQSTKIYSQAYSLGDSSFLKLDLKLERRHLFYTVYIFIPLICLSLLNLIVFGMPASSGERLGVAVTMFLSFIVFMESISQNIPESSNPMSILYYYLLYLIVYSSCILFLCVASLRIYDKTGDVPPTIVAIVKVLRCWHCVGGGRIRAQQNRSKDATDNSKTDLGDGDADEIGTSYNEVEPVSVRVTWRTVGMTFDRYVAGFFLINHMFFSSVSFHYLRTKELVFE